ncbi:hypothetical protein HU200_026350 [Digitaria exilis]|uniref:Prenyl transferase n=1 Tax=Digitaria exilis TaxID=1010633 RepID=A0A835C984_9POAL|nr:hypothetical protein HU200_026350 [Digitaria exilis]
MLSLSCPGVSMSKKAFELGQLASCRCRSPGTRAAPRRRRTPCVCSVASPAQPGLFLSLVRSLVTYRCVCAGLAAIDVPRQTIPTATTPSVPERISVSSLLEVVSDDLLNLNNNLKSVSFVYKPHPSFLPHCIMIGSFAGKETIHQLYGTRVAVLAGDFMFAQSSWFLANLENIEVIKLISQVIKDFASGEIKQASTLFDCDVTLDDYLLKSYYKTASLIAASTRSAAIFSGVGATICEQMYEYGRNLGLSFQVVDDILDFTQSAEQLGKPAGSDLAKGNLTAPVIFALQEEPRLREIIDSEFSEPGSLGTAIELVHRSGGIRRAQELAKEKGDLAIQSLQCLPRSEFRNTLEKVVHYNLQRID